VDKLWTNCRQAVDISLARRRVSCRERFDCVREHLIASGRAPESNNRRRHFPVTSTFIPHDGYHYLQSLRTCAVSNCNIIPVLMPPICNHSIQITEWLVFHPKTSALILPYAESNAHISEGLVRYCVRQCWSIGLIGKMCHPTDLFDLWKRHAVSICSVFIMGVLFQVDRGTTSRYILFVGRLSKESKMAFWGMEWRW